METVCRPASGLRVNGSGTENRARVAVTSLPRPSSSGVPAGQTRSACWSTSPSRAAQSEGSGRHLLIPRSKARILDGPCEKAPEAGLFCSDVGEHACG